MWAQLSLTWAQLGPILTAKVSISCGRGCISKLSAICVVRRPRWPQDGPKMASRCPRTAPRGPMRATRKAQGGPAKGSPRGVQGEPKTAPRPPLDASKSLPRPIHKPLYNGLSSQPSKRPSGHPPEPLKDPSQAAPRDPKKP